MENGTRVQKGIINMLAGSLGTLIMGVIQFASRIVFIQFLSDEYLGISSLFTNIMSILSLTELGIGNAVAFALYQPLADADREKIKSIMKFLQKTYMLIGIVIVGLGAVLFPFMPWLIAGNTDLVNINLIFLFYVLQSASSYWFFSYKGILLQADQKMYVIKAYTIIATFFVTIIQLVTLALWRDFILYSLIGLFTNVLVNILVACKVDKQYPFIRDKQHIAFSKEEKQNLFKNVLGMSLFKINTTIVNSTDNIVISAFVNLKMVALYGNYQLIISGISQVVMGFFGGITATIGNINVEEDKEKKEFIFRCIQFLCYWLYTFAAIGIVMLVNPVIEACFGDERVFSWELVMLQVTYFVINGFQRTSFIYRDACGLFWKGKWRPIATAILNIVISVFLAKRIGLAGVILGTILSWLMTTWWYDPVVIYRNVFNKSVFRYFVEYGKAVLMFISLTFLTVKISSLIPFTGIVQFICNIMLVVLVPNLGYYLVYHKTEEFDYIKMHMRKMIKKVKGKIPKNR